MDRRFVKSKLIDWSRKLEQSSTSYRDHNGKITENSKPTSAINRYVNLAKDFGVIRLFGNTMSNTKLGLLFYELIKQEDEFSFTLSDTEKIFFLILLFSIDADGIILSLDILGQLPQPISQTNIQKEFGTKFRERLVTLQTQASSTALEAIREKYRVLEFEWKNAESYSEHIIIPRLEWLADLGVISISKEKGKSIYEITDQGDRLVASFNQDTVHFINDDWIRRNSMHAFSNLIYERDNSIKSWSDLSDESKNSILEKLLDEAFSLLNREGALRISYYPSQMLITIKTLIHYKVIMEIEDFDKIFELPLRLNGKEYFLKQSARKNESYISINFN